jgi:predicted dehydrogenase
MKVGILGAGGMGCTVIGQLKTCPEVDGIVAYDVDAARVRHAVEAQGVTGAARLEDVLGDPAVRLVFITAANHAHKELAIRSMEAGKAVLCEKPMAVTLDDARAMVETGERLGAFFQVGFELRYSKLYAKVKEWVDAGLLGRVVNTHCLYCASAYDKAQWRNTAEHGGNTFGERLSHYVDLTRWWIGEPVETVYSVCAPNVVPYTEVHDNYHTTYRFRGGAVSHISYYMNYPATFRGDPLADSITDLQLGDGHKLRYIVVGTEGAAETDVFYRRIKRWRFTDTPERMASDWVENLSWTFKEDHFYYHNTTDQTLDVVRRVAGGLPPMTPARDALETMKLCFAAEESAANNRELRL